MISAGMSQPGADYPRSDTWAEQCPAPWPQDLVAVPEGTCPAPMALDTAAAEPCLWAGQPGLHQVGQELVPCSPWHEDKPNLPPVGLPAAALGMLKSPHLGSWLAAPGGIAERGPGTAWTQLPGASSCTARGQGRDRGMTGRGWRQGRRAQARRGGALKSRPSGEPGAAAGCAGSGVRYPVPECNASAGT